METIEELKAQLETALLRVRELEAEKARMFYWVHYDCTNENCAGDGENCPGKRIETNHG